MIEQTPLQREHARTIFQKGAPGRRAFTCPAVDVPEVDVSELLPERFRRTRPPALPATIIGMPSTACAFATEQSECAKIRQLSSNVPSPSGMPLIASRNSFQATMLLCANQPTCS